MKAPATAALEGYRDIWTTKPALRAVYDDFYDRLAAACRAGLTIEIGGGIGNLKKRLKDTITTDIQYAPWLDCVADAQRLPFAGESAGNIVMVDVLHHIEFPIELFREAARVLRPGGRLLAVEPAITRGSVLFYRIFHHEPVCMSARVLAEGAPAPGRDPYIGNQAIPTLLATRERDRFHHLCPGLRLVRVDWFSFASYPMTGGFKPWSLLGPGIARRMLRIERAIEPLLGRAMAFRMMLTVEKRSHGEG
jgi:SAM-dependent methyltransferase